MARSGASVIRRKRRDFEDWYADARAYYLAHGDLLVPADYETPEGYRLGKWISAQRGKYLHRPSMKASLTGTEIALLEKIGMVWRLEWRFSWEEWMSACRTYREEHGDLLVPADYRIGDCHLGNWIRERRKLYWKGELPPEQIRDLDALGMAWAVGFQREWDDWYEDARRYRKEHGDLLVPTVYETPEGFALGVWISEQRRIATGRKRAERLTETQRGRLDALDMVWDIRAVRTDAWEEMYRFVAAYREENGKLPVNPRGVLAPNGRRMDNWVRTQRQYLAEGKCSAERAGRLAQIGIVKPEKQAKTGSRGEPTGARDGLGTVV